jgi:2-polyprenyl-6-methoxyphenol hydroxylase-like FAD-dependent oxidoreductase
VTVQVQATEQPKFSIGNSYANGNEFPILEMRGRIVVGSDGINSLCRSVIRAATGKNDDTSRYCGELCYRGVCELKKNSEISTIFLENEKKKPAAMTIFYGDGIRASWGMIDQKNTQGFWWIKVKSPKPDPDPKAPLSWPPPLNLLHQSTDPALLYVHPILDRVPSNKWCSERIVLVGDAAHPVTPNMGQGKNRSSTISKKGNTKLLLLLLFY